MSYNRVTPEVIEELKSIVGAEHVSDKPAVLAAYLSRSIMGIEAVKPDVVVRPKYVEEVRKVLMLANEYRIPVTPMAGGLSGGFALPLIKPAGILLDLSRMNRILKVDPDARYMVVEPGVRNGPLWAYFRKNYPEYAPPIPDGAPPAATVVGDALERGFTIVTNKAGPAADLVLGLEVVLPTGEVVRTGSWALPGAQPFYKWGLGPDFTGIFLGAQGTMGVVTKLAVKIFPHSEHKDILAFGFENPQDMIEATMMVLKQEVGVMVQGGNWWLVPTRLAEENPKLADYQYWAKLGVPLWFMNFELWGRDEEDLEYQRRVVRREMEKAAQAGIKVREWKLHPRQKKSRLKKPNKIAIPYAKWRGAFLFITWYTPWMEAGDFAEICVKKMEEYGFPPVFWVASIEHGREAICMPIVCYDPTSPDEIERLREFNRDTTEMFIERGWINYRPDPYVHAPLMYSRATAYYSMLKKLKKVFDPNGIMHPGRLCLP